MPTMIFRHAVALWCIVSLGCINPHMQAQRCISQERLQAQLHNDPAAAEARQALETFTRRYVAEYPVVQWRSSVTIPVVFHVVWRLPEENLTEEQILSQLAVLNQDFRFTNAIGGLIPTLFQPFAADVEINFCLARRTPDGAATSGIVRIPTPHNFIGDRTVDGRKAICYTADGGSDAWDPARYLNIWVGRRQIFPAEASFPGAGLPQEDGIIIDPRFVGTVGTAAGNQPYHQGRTLTHELGHYFNLYHLWGPGQPGSCNQSDEVADTPVQSKTYLGECPTHPQITCGTPDMFMNYMTYANDACMAMFTLGQKARMWAALQGARAGLLQSEGCLPVNTHQPEFAGVQVLNNPAGREGIHLKVSGVVSEKMTYALFTVSGQPVAEGRIAREGITRVDTSQLPSGIYFLAIAGPGVPLLRRIVVMPHR